MINALKYIERLQSKILNWAYDNKKGGYKSEQHFFVMGNWHVVLKPLMAKVIFDKMSLSEVKKAIRDHGILDMYPNMKNFKGWA